MKAIDTTVLAFVKANPGCSAREVGEMLGATSTRSRERHQAHASLGRLRDMGMIEGDGYPTRWIAVEREQIHDPEYVDLVIARLADLRRDSPERHHHDIDCCMVDLQRALGRVPG